MIVIPSLHNATVFEGDFLLAMMSADGTSPTVCRVSKALNYQELIVTWWISLADVASRPNFEEPPPVPIETYSNTLKCRLTEVLEVRSSSSTINVNAVKDIAFVFHINVVEHEYPNCAGMSRVFYTRYQYNDRDVLVVVDSRVHCPFSCVVLDSYTTRIWYSILDVKRNVEKMLNDAKQYQLCKKMALISFSLESWYFLCSNLVNSGASVVNLQRRHTGKRMHCDLTLSSFKEKLFITLLRIDSSRSMSGARQIFGSTFGVGVRNRPPNKDEKPVSLKYSDVVNLVDVVDNAYDDAGFVEACRLSEFVAALGVDFLYDAKYRLLKIRVRYRKVDAHLPVVASTLKMDQLEVHNVNAAPLNRWVRHIKPGTYFATQDGHMVSVIRLEGRTVYGVLDGCATEVQYDINEAAALLQAYIC
jgi:hypothetical protein